jgi:transcriptional regulator with XRE-family HTH domain
MENGELLVLLHSIMPPRQANAAYRTMQEGRTMSRKLGTMLLDARTAQEQYTAAGLARALGVTRGFWADVEKGNRIPSVPILEEAARLLGIERDVLLDVAGRLDPTMLAYLHDNAGARDLLAALLIARTPSARVREMADSVTVAHALIPLPYGFYCQPAPLASGVLADPTTLEFLYQVTKVLRAFLNANGTWWNEDPYYYGGTANADKPPHERRIAFRCQFCSEVGSTPQAIVHKGEQPAADPQDAPASLCGVVRAWQLLSVLEVWIVAMYRDEPTEQPHE